MNWAAVTAVCAVLGFLLSLGVFFKLSFFVGRIVEKVESNEKAIRELPCWPHGVCPDR